MCHVNKSHDDDMSDQKSLILYVSCFSLWKNCSCVNKWLNFLPLTEMMSKSCKNNFRKFLSNAAIKTNILYIFPRLNQRINLVCKYDIEFCSENERKRYVTCMTALKFVAWFGSELSLHEFKWYQICQPWIKKKRAKRKTKISKVCNLTITLVWEPYGSCWSIITFCGEETSLRISFS